MFKVLFICPYCKIINKCNSQTINVPSERKTRDGAEYNEYKGDDAHEVVFQQVLKQIYFMFRLFNGTILQNLIGVSEDIRIEHLIEKLNQFYSKVSFYILVFCVI